MVITNLIVSELLISFIGVPLDLIGATSQGKANNSVLCPTTGFAHTLCGMLISLLPQIWHQAINIDFLTTNEI